MAKYMSNDDALKAKQIIHKKLTGWNKMQLNAKVNKIVWLYSQRKFNEVKQLMLNIENYLIELTKIEQINETDAQLLTRYYLYESVESARAEKKYWKNKK